MRKYPDCSLKNRTLPEPPRAVHLKEPISPAETEGVAMTLPPSALSVTAVFSDAETLLASPELYLSALMFELDTSFVLSMRYS